MIIQFILALAFFWCLQFIARWYLFRRVSFRSFNYFILPDDENNDSRQLSIIPPNKKWRISNECISLVHSIVSGLWAGYVLISDKQFSEDPIQHRSPMADNLILFSAAYMFHDLVDLLANEQSARILELLIHHITVLTAFFVTIWTNLYLGVVVYGLLMELNSVFLHCRSLLNHYGVSKKRPIFRMTAFFNMITLVVFRLAVNFFLARWLIGVLPQLPIFQAIINSLVTLTLCISNSVLAYRVMAADGLLGKSRARKCPTQVHANSQEESTDVEDEDDSSTLSEIIVQSDPVK
ncbi:hypothetical protein WR25_14604 [Diploscapter pachys]|uniref:TLC domain-containing protein n=1 Tax=Diploscapter pachys TaxID=2018661 RepID=A0A2A2LW83_9BILA|nr:hypothetical protein WR25_14604 [Diploscapter pachys]